MESATFIRMIKIYLLVVSLWGFNGSAWVYTGNQMVYQEKFEDIVTKNDKAENNLEGQNVKPTAEKIEAERSDIDIMEAKLKEQVAKKETETTEKRGKEEVYEV